MTLSATILVGDALARLRELPAASVHCCVTSPPYFGLRDYGTAEWEGGDAGCDHKAPPGGGTGASTLGPNGDGLGQAGVEQVTVQRRQQYRSVCGKCGARRVDRQIGLEETPAAYVARLVEVFREVRRVLRPDGTCWLNVGDSYTGSANSGGNGKQDTLVRIAGLPCLQGKPKDMLGIPWQVAFALRDDGWYLRSEIIWHKPAPMPESVRDRPTKAHEQVFLLAARPRYYWDAEAIAEPLESPPHAPGNKKWANGDRNDGDRMEAVWGSATGRNARSVWTIGPTPFAGAHFATMPEGLAEKCLLAGTSARGVCPACGASWVRVVERNNPSKASNIGEDLTGGAAVTANPQTSKGLHRNNGGVYSTAKVLGWRPACTCPAADPAPAVVLDPFGGAMTTALVAARLGRSSVSIELNPAYADMGARRVRGELGLVCQVEVRT